MFVLHTIYIIMNNKISPYDLIPKRISECAIYVSAGNPKSCASKEVIQKIGTTLKQDVGLDIVKIVEAAKKETNCDSEKCVLEAKRGEMGEMRSVVDRELKNNYKIEGPRDSSWLSNVNIDAALQMWATNKFRDFFPYNFNMRDYARYSINEKNVVVEKPDTLATVFFEDLYERGFRCAACVVNIDRYHGKGKHWLALFADARSDTDDWSVEIFDSAGSPPLPEWQSWAKKTEIQMNEIISQSTRPDRKVHNVRVGRTRQQDSNSECGVYSLFYIWARLNGVPYKWFMENRIYDKVMFEFRQHLFSDPDFADGVEFDFEEYKKKVKIDWVGSRSSVQSWKLD
jgi:hypothetical protein